VRNSKIQGTDIIILPWIKAMPYFTKMIESP